MEAPPLLGIFTVVAALLLMVRGRIVAEEESQQCDESLIVQAQVCVAKLALPKDNGTVCEYLKQGVDCFPDSCCADEKYNQGVWSVINTAEQSGCETAGMCSGAQIDSVSLHLLTSSAFGVILLLF